MSRQVGAIMDECYAFICPTCKVTFLLGVTDLRLKRFYVADVIACSLWALALALLVVSVGSIFK